jgi:hypothetical protein
MRWHILRTLLHKEALRHLANRGGLALVLLLVVASLLLSLFGGDQQAPGFAPGVRLCYVDYWQDGPLIDHLRENVPEALDGKVRFRPLEAVPTDSGGVIIYPQNTGAIQLRPLPGGTGDAKAPPDKAAYKVWFWHPGADGTALAPFEAWFWKETLRFSEDRSGPTSAGDAIDGPVLRLQTEHSELIGGLDPRSGMATALVIFGLFFVCVYLMPSLTCEERERGVLLAQALSPASPREILAAKFLFYPPAALALAALLAGTYRPAVLLTPFFWLALTVSVVGSMGVGLTIASLARTQRAASLGALCYMLAVALILFICQQNNIPGLPYLALEYHAPRMIHAALTGSVVWYHWGHLAGAAVLAVVWALIAVRVFRRYGWQ